MTPSSFPGPPALHDLGHAEPLPDRFARLLPIRSADQEGGRPTTSAETQWLGGLWNALVAHDPDPVWRPGRPFELFGLKTAQALGLQFANGTQAILLTPGVRPVDRRRRSWYAPVPPARLDASEGFWLCRGELIDAYDAHIAWLDPQAALAAYRRVLARHPELSPNGWRVDMPPLKGQRGRQAEADARHRSYRAELDAQPEAAAAEFACAYAYLSVAERLPCLFARDGRNSYGLKHEVEAWLRRLAGRGRFTGIPYLGNGALIAAALYRGWTCERLDGPSPNCRLRPGPAAARAA